MRGKCQTTQHHILNSVYIRKFGSIVACDPAINYLTRYAGMHRVHTDLQAVSTQLSDKFTLCKTTTKIHTPGRTQTIHYVLLKPKRHISSSLSEKFADPCTITRLHVVCLTGQSVSAAQLCLMIVCEDMLCRMRQKTYRVQHRSVDLHHHAVAKVRLLSVRTRCSRIHVSAN